MDFAKLIEEASKLPESAEEQALPDIFGGAMDPAALITINKGDDGTSIPGQAKFDFVYASARLTIGKELEAFENGVPIYRDVDESDELKVIMDNVLSANFTLLKKQETFLKDGTVVVWIEWMERKPRERLGSKEMPIFTEEELLSPELPLPVKGLDNSR